MTYAGEEDRNFSRRPQLVTQRTRSLAQTNYLGQHSAVTRSWPSAWLGERLFNLYRWFEFPHKRRSETPLNAETEEVGG
jgi:hypothetical protein